MPGWQHLGGASATANNVAVPVTLTANAFVAVVVKAITSTAPLGTGSVTDDFSDLGAWSKQAGDEHANGGGIDADATAWVGIFTALAATDTLGTITATVTNAAAIRADVYEIEDVLAVAASGANGGDVGVPGTLAVTLSAAPALEEYTLGGLCWFDFTTPSGIDNGAGCTTTSSGSYDGGAISALGGGVLRWLDQQRTESSDEEMAWVFTGGDEWAEAAAAITVATVATVELHPLYDDVELLVEAAFGSDPLSGEYTWTDVTELLDGAAELLVEPSGRDDELSDFQPGTIQAVFATSERELDPSNAAGPHYGELLPRVPLRVSASYGGTLYRLALGYVRSWPQEEYGDGATTLVPVEAVDAFSLLSITECPRSEYELRVRQDSPLVYYPLDDSVGGYTRDASENDFAGQLPHGLEPYPTSEYGGEGGALGDYSATGIYYGVATHTVASDVDIATVECLLDIGVNRFTVYSGAGTESYSQLIASLRSGLASWNLVVRRVYSTTAQAGNFDEDTYLDVAYTDGTNDAEATVTLGSTTFFDPQTATSAQLQARQQKAVVNARNALKKAQAARDADRRSAVQAWVLTARNHPGAANARKAFAAANRQLKEAERNAKQLQEAVKEATIAAREAAATLLFQDVPREEFERRLHVAATAFGGDITVYLDGVAVGTGTTGTVTDVRTPGEVEVVLAPRGVAVGHVAAYEERLDAQTILEHSVTAKVGLGVQHTGTRALMVLRAVQWPDNLTRIDTGSSYIAGAPSSDVVSYLHTLAESEQGRCFVAPDGRVTFRGRMWALQAAEATTPQAALEDTGVPEERYVAISVRAADEESIANDVTASREDGVQQRRYVPRAERTSGVFHRDYSGLLLTSDLTVGEFAAGMLRRHKDAKEAIDSLVLDPRLKPATHYPVVLGVGVGYRLTASRHPQGVGAAFTQDVTVEGIRHIISSSGWETEYRAIPAYDSAEDAPWAVAGVSLFDGDTPLHF